MNTKKENYKRIPLDVKLDLYDQIKAKAADNGEAVNTYIKRLIIADLNKKANSSVSRIVGLCTRIFKGDQAPCT